MALLPNFPISGDDYTVGTITTVAGSKDFTTKDAYLQSYGAVQAGDHIYIAAAGKFLIIASITGENSGTLTDPCPADCAVTDADLRIIFKTASSRLQGRTAMLLERLAKGCLASLAELSPTEGQIFRATNVEGQLEAVDNTADNVIETDGRKFMTDKDRQSIANIDKRVSDLTTAQIKETDTAKIMTAAERVKLANINALAATIWNAGADGTEALISPAKLRDAINARFGGNPASGWVRMPNGILVQWGITNINDGYAQAIYPTAFTTDSTAFSNVIAGWENPGYAAIAYHDIAVSNHPVLRLTKCGFMCRQVNGTSGVSDIASGSLFWLAIGY